MDDRTTALRARCASLPEPSPAPERPWRDEELGAILRHQLFGIDLVHEHELAQRVYGLGLEELRRMNRAAAAASFLPADVRQRLIAAVFPG